MLLAILQKLQIVLEPALDQLFHRNLPVDFVPIKHPLQHLVIVEKLVLRLDVELHLAHGHIAVDGVHNLAVDGALAALLHLGDFRLQQLVDPLYQFLSRHVVEWSL